MESGADRSTPGRGVASEAWGGVASGLVALPSSIAYGVAVYATLGAAYVGFGARAGVLGAIALGIVAPLLGGAPRLISAPCAPAAAVLGALAAELAARRPGGVDPARVIVLLTVLAIAAGTLQALYGLLGGGRLIKYIPYPVVAGYLSGVGALIVIGQLPALLGVGKDLALRAALVAPRTWQAPALVVAAVTIAGVLFAPRLTRAVPATIVGLAAGVATHLALGISRPDLLDPAHCKLLIGPVGGGGGGILSSLAGQWAALGDLRSADLRALLVPALTLSVLLSIDTLKTCVVVDALTRSRHDSNRELLAQGTGNFVSALAGGMPGAGTMGATLVNLSSGGRTRLSGSIEGLFVLAAYAIGGGLIAWVPRAALGGILVVVAARMFDWRSFRLLRRRSTALDFAVIMAVVVVAVRGNLIAASATGLALAIILFIREQARGSVIRRKVSGTHLSSKQRRLPADREILEKNGALTTVCELQGSLFFGTVDQMISELEPDLARCRYLILDMRRVQSVDFTAAHMLEGFESALAERGGFLIFSRVPPSLPTGQDLRAYFSEVGVTRPEHSVLRLETLDDALQWVEDRILAEARPSAVAEDGPLALSEIDLLKGLDPKETLEPLAACAEERAIDAGQTIFRCGDAGDELYLIRRGVVRIVLPLEGGTHHNLASFGRGDFFGELAFLDRGKRSADAIATSATELYVISRERIDAAFRDHPAGSSRLFARLARALALRLRRADAEVRALYES
ncbi:MAG: SulP family inorganic anion transporter [Acidobacteriota bacterium]